MLARKYSYAVMAAAVAVIVASIAVVRIVNDGQSAPTSPLFAQTVVTATMWLECGDFECSFHVQNGIGEVQVANGWTAWWMEADCPAGVANCYNLPCMPWEDGCYVQCPLNCQKPTCEQVDYGCWWSRPEFRDTSDVTRVHSGSRAQKYFSYGRQHRAGLYQQVDVAQPGSLVRFSVWVQGWQCRNYTDCCKNWKPCVSDYPYRMNFAVGIDPFGGIDPTSENVVWSRPTESFDKWSQIAVQAVAMSDTITVFTSSFGEFDWARLNNDVYLDDAEVVVIENPQFVYLPVVLGGSAQSPSPDVDLTRAALLMIPGNITMSVGSTATVFIVAENISDARYLEAEYGYDPLVIEVVGAELGPFLSLDGYTPEMLRFFGIEGAALYSDTVRIESFGIQGSGKVVAALQIRAIGVGETAIRPFPNLPPTPIWVDLSCAACLVGFDGGGGVNPVCEGVLVRVTR